MQVEKREFEIAEQILTVNQAGPQGQTRWALVSRLSANFFPELWLQELSLRHSFGSAASCSGSLGSWESPPGEIVVGSYYIFLLKPTDPDTGRVL